MVKTLRWLESVRQTRYQLIAYDLMGHLLIDLGMNRRAVEQCERGCAGRAGGDHVLGVAHRRTSRSRGCGWDISMSARCSRARSPSAGATAKCPGAALPGGLAELSLARGDALAASASPRSFCHSWSRRIEELGAEALAGVARRFSRRAISPGPRGLCLRADMAERIGRPRLAATRTALAPSRCGQIRQGAPPSRRGCEIAARIVRSWRLGAGVALTAPEA
jgi:hypothetical protein